MSKLVFILGMPGAGKSALVQSVIDNLGEPGKWVQARAPKLNYAKGLAYPMAKTLVLGIYDHTLFSGTDRLGRNCGPSAITLLQRFAVSPTYAGWNILAEGDRLTTQAFFTAVKELSVIDIVPVLLKVPAALCAERRANREAVGGKEWLETVASKMVAGKPRRADRLETGLSEVWLRGRETKLANLLRLLTNVVELPNETLGDLRLATEVVASELGVTIEESNSESITTRRRTELAG